MVKTMDTKLLIDRKLNSLPAELLPGVLDYLDVLVKQHSPQNDVSKQKKPNSGLIGKADYPV